MQESDVHAALKSGVALAHERAEAEGPRSGAGDMPRTTCEMQAPERARASGSMSGASVYASLPKEREFKAWRRPDSAFHFPCEGLAEGHSPTDYDPGMAEKLAASMSESAPPRSQVLELVRLLPSERAPRGGEAATSRSFTSGAWAKDGAIGFRHNSSLFPQSTKILTALIREAFPSATFCSVAVFTDLKAEPHIDSNNDERFMNRTLPLSSFQGGSVWVESSQGGVERSYRGRKRIGVLLDVAAGPVSLDSSALHATEPWVGSRVVLVAYCPRNMRKLGSESLIP